MRDKDGNIFGVIKFGADIVVWFDHGQEAMVPTRNPATGNITHTKRGRFTAFNQTTGVDQPVDSFLMDAIKEDIAKQEEKG